MISHRLVDVVNCLVFVGRDARLAGHANNLALAVGQDLPRIR
jgi:hypothetical protein